METNSSTDVKFYTAEGYPEGGEIEHFVEAHPALLMLDPPIGSAGGTKLLVTGSGFGLKTEGLNLKVGSTELCASVEVTEWGKFTCMTKPISIAAGQSVKITLNGVASADSFIASDVSYS